MDKRRQYKDEEDYRKSYTKSIPIALSQEILDKIEKVSREVYEDRYSRSYVIRKLINLGLNQLIKEDDESS